MSDMPSFDGRAVINGERVAARDGQTFDCLSPVDGRLLTPVARCGAADIDAAVAAARAAFEDRRWAGKAPAARKRILIRFAELIQAHGDLLARQHTRLDALQARLQARAVLDAP